MSLKKRWLGTFRKDDDDGSENVGKNIAFFHD